MFLQVLKLVALGLLIQWLFGVFIMFDNNKRVYNHRPGKCRQIKGIDHGSEDIEVIHGQKIAFITSGLVYLPVPEIKIDYKGRIFVYDLSKRDYSVKQIPVENLEDEEGFHPHGLSHWILQDGTIRLFVVVHSKTFQHAIVLLDYDNTKQVLRHVRTIRDPAFVRPNDVVATGPNSFLVSNDGGAQSRLGNAFEAISGLYQGSLIYFDGHASHTLLSSTIANGISVSSNRNTLFVSHINQETIGVYQWDQKNIVVHKISEIPTMTGCDNFYIDENDHLWSGCHPVLKDGIPHLNNFTDNSLVAPSQVLRLAFSADFQTAKMVEVLADEGHLISASSIAVGFDSNKQLLIGSVAREMVHCDIDVALDF